MEEEKKVRWRYFIDRDFQNKFMLRFSLIIILVVVFTLGILWLLQANPYSSGLLPAKVLWSLKTDQAPVMAGPPGKQFPLFKPDKPYNAFQLFWKPIVFVGALNLLLIVIFSLFYSHSMAGPIHNIKQSIRELLDGDDPRTIRVRKGDQFQDLAELLNELVEKRVK